MTLASNRSLLVALLAAATTGGCTARFAARGTVRTAPPPPARATVVVHTPAQAPPPPIVPPAPPVVQPAPPPPPIVQPAPPLQIAGTPVVRVGVNFEDQGAHGDRDYNDAVMCFQGRFKVDGTQVVSTERQEVIASTSSISACRHRVRVEIIHADGGHETPVEFASNSGARVAMHFEPGSRLEVSVQSLSGGCSSDVMSMHDQTAARVLLDQCNTTGR
ncbi:MAG: hypothetical protein IPL61_17250 [Myxococcales bacterium]|nr:hypothetical protein [Myxococcales bacterium]